MEEPNIAILSPGVNVYSETFILAHKELLRGNLFFYYDGLIPTKLDGKSQNAPDSLTLSQEDSAKSLEDQETLSLYKLKESLRKNNIKVVLAEYGVTAARALPAVKHLGLPLIIHFHGYDAYENDLLTKMSREYEDMFEYAYKIIVVSRAMEKQVISLGCPKSKIVNAPYGARQEFFSLKPEFKTKQFLSVGRFVPKKAPYYTILAFSEAAREFPEARLKMAADGPLLDVCKKMVKYCGIQDKVTFSGPLSHESIMKEMEKSLALIQHSVIAQNGDSEGTPVAILEAGAAGIPVIATRHAGIPDVLVNNVTGILIDEHDVPGMGAAMKRLLTDKKLAKQMGSKAKQRIAENFGPRNNIDTVDSTITRALKHNPPVSSGDEIFNSALRRDKYYIKYLKKQKEDLTKQIEEIKNSTTWIIGAKITAPLSAVKRLIRG